MLRLRPLPVVSDVAESSGPVNELEELDLASSNASLPRSRLPTHRQAPAATTSSESPASSGLLAGWCTAEELVRVAGGCATWLAPGRTAGAVLTRRDSPDLQTPQPSPGSYIAWPADKHLITGCEAARPGRGPGWATPHRGPYRGLFSGRVAPRHPAESPWPSRGACNNLLTQAEKRAPKRFCPRWLSDSPAPGPRFPTRM